MSSPKRLILVTNDDGITAPGIAALIEAMKPLGQIYVVAPDKPQSGVGHAITINSTLRINRVNFYKGITAFSTSGTPVDCVKIALDKILPTKPHLIVSGINHGSNLSINVIYSGTMSAAIEGAIEGIPAIGFSLLHDSIEADFSAACHIAQVIARTVLSHKLPENICLNVNIPRLPLQEIRGIRICRQARAYWKEHFEERKDPAGNPYFWLTGEFINYDKNNSDTDVWAVENNYVSVVPVQFDLTGYSALRILRKWKFSINNRKSSSRKNE